MEKRNTLEAELAHLLEEQKEKEEHEHHHHHHDHEHDHDHDEHEHHHEYDEHGVCSCGHHHDDHDHEHHHHHADEVFQSFGIETAKHFSKTQIEDIRGALSDESAYGLVLRAKGIVAGEGDKWIHFDYVPEESNVREGSAIVTGRLCVIGSKLNEEALKDLFN